MTTLTMATWLVHVTIVMATMLQEENERKDDESRGTKMEKKKEKGRLDISSRIPAPKRGNNERLQQFFSSPPFSLPPPIDQSIVMIVGKTIQQGYLCHCYCINKHAFQLYLIIWFQHNINSHRLEQCHSPMQHFNHLPPRPQEATARHRLHLELLF